MTFPEEQNVLEGYCTCPICGSMDGTQDYSNPQWVLIGDGNEGSLSTEMFFDCKCPECGKEWVEFYKLDRIEKKKKEQENGHVTGKE